MESSPSGESLGVGLLFVRRWGIVRALEPVTDGRPGGASGAGLAPARTRQHDT